MHLDRLGSTLWNQFENETSWCVFRSHRDNDAMASNLNGSDYVYRKTGLSGMVTFEKLWEGALWPYAKNMSWESGWQQSLAAIANFSAELAPWFQNDTISTIFLGDEMCCPSGCQKRYGKHLPPELTAMNFTQNSSAALRALRAAVGPKPLFYMNSCPDWQPEKWPEELDLFSTDYYHPGNATEDVIANKHFYQENLCERDPRADLL